MELKLHGTGQGREGDGHRMDSIDSTVATHLDISITMRRPESGSGGFICTYLNNSYYVHGCIWAIYMIGGCLSLFLKPANHID